MAGALTISTLNNDTGVLATQNGMNGIAKAWLSYNAQTSTILNSFNISSVTYIQAGYFALNFATAMPNTNYSVIGFARGDSPSSNVFGYVSGLPNDTKTTSTMRIMQGVQQNGVTYQTANSPELNVAVFA